MIDASYFGLVRTELLELIPSQTKRLLDVGCGFGVTARAAKDRFQLEAIGIEVNQDAAKVAETKLDRVIVGDIEQLKLDFPAGYFDCILCADILEHTKDPWKVLTYLKSFLAEEGILLASIPNIRHVAPILKILFNRFEYQDSGVLDRTHLRFFTLHTIRQMFDQAGFVMSRITTNRTAGWKYTLMSALSFGLLRSFSVHQYIVLARKK